MRKLVYVGAADLSISGGGGAVCALMCIALVYLRRKRQLPVEVDSESYNLNMIFFSGI